MEKVNNALPLEKQDGIIGILKARFETNIARHREIKWEDVNRRLTTNTEKLRSLYEMEATGGEPDVISYNNSTDEFIVIDCSAESPKGRRSVCYDREALEGRKENKPRSSAIDMAYEMDIEILTQDQYRDLQKYGKFDTKTSSWVKTPDNIRKLGGAIFCDYRYDTVFVYHNSAESYYSSRGFRGLLKL